MKCGSTFCGKVVRFSGEEPCLMSRLCSVLNGNYTVSIEEEEEEKI